MCPNRISRRPNVLSGLDSLLMLSTHVSATRVDTLSLRDAPSWAASNEKSIPTARSRPRNGRVEHNTPRRPTSPGLPSSPRFPAVEQRWSPAAPRLTMTGAAGLQVSDLRVGDR